MSLVVSASVLTARAGNTQSFPNRSSKAKAAVLPSPLAPPLDVHWALAGNSVVAGNYIGTNAASAYKPLVFCTNAVEAMRIDASGLVGIGTTTPAARLDVFGTGNAVVQGTNSNSANGSAAVSGQSTSATGVPIGVYGNCFSDQGRGVFGAARATVGNAIGVYGYSASDNGYGVYGYAADQVGLNYGVFGKSDSPQGYAGYFQGRGYFAGNLGVGTATPSANLEVQASPFAVYAVKSTNPINSNGAAAIFGHATSTTSVTVGVEGDCQSVQGRGVFGAARNTTGVSIGVYGYTASGDPAGYGVFSSGNLGAAGFKSFKIDHPMDPENRYLMHYSTESPEPMNFYSGLTTTDNQGCAWVQLPDYFAMINKDFRYALTVVDDTDSDTFVMAKVAREIRGNRFKIRTNAAHVKVSWRVEAVRNDRWVQVHGSPVELDKVGSEKGKYLRPELYGKPANMGIDYHPQNSVKGENATGKP